MSRKHRQVPSVPPSPAKWAGFWLIAAPAAVHLFWVYTFGSAADSSPLVLIGVVLASVFTGLMASGAGYGFVTAALAAAWSPMLFTWRHWYWGMDMHSPAGDAQRIAASFGWSGAPAPLAIGAVAAAWSCVGWITASAARRNASRAAKQRLRDYGKPGHDARP